LWKSASRHRVFVCPEPRWRTFAGIFASVWTRRFHVSNGALHASVHLADVNGPRGGYDKHCMVKVSLGGATAALAQGSDRNLFALVNRVSVCAAQVTLKRLKRRLGNATVRTMSDTSADTHRDA
jgi:hypothetical protein